MSVYLSLLENVEPWTAPKFSDPALSFLCKHGGTHIRRLVLRDCRRLRNFYPIARHCTRLRTLDLSCNTRVDDACIAGLCVGIGSTLKSLILRRCISISDIALSHIATKCTSLSALDVSGVPELTDCGVALLARYLRHSLSILLLSWCYKVTDLSLQALASCRLQAIFLRGLSISDAGVASLTQHMGTSLQVIDLLDCPDITNTTFSHTIRETCPLMAKKLQRAADRDIFQNAVSLLDGYVRVVHGMDQYRQRRTVICIVDAGCGNAFEFHLLSGGALLLESDDVKVIATNPGLSISAETEMFLEKRFGIVLRDET